MKKTTLLVTLGVALAAFAFSQGQGGPPQGGPPQGGPGFGGPGGPGMDRGIPPLDRLVFRRDVQADIKISDDQKSKLDALRPQRGPGGPGGPPPDGQGGPPPFNQAPDPQGGPPQGGFGGGGQRGPGGNRQSMEADRKKMEAAISAILTSDQLARVKQIGIQLAGSRAVLDKDIQAQLGITSDQKAKIDATVKTQQAANRSLFEQAQNGDLDQGQMRSAMQQNDKTFQSKLSEILTSDQASKLTAMGGDKFTATDREGPGGGPGGPGGPPPGGGGGFGPPPNGGQ